MMLYVRETRQLQAVPLSLLYKSQKINYESMVKSFYIVVLYLWY